MISIVKSALAFGTYTFIFFIRWCFSRKKLPKILSQTLVKLGPVYIKLGQVISSRRDVMPEKYTKELESLCDDVPAEKDAIMKKIIQKAYPQGIDKVFADISETSIAAGAVAQVYSAHLLNGDKVAVKVLRPKIRQSIEENFRFIKLAVRFLEFFSAQVRIINIRGVVNELEELLLTQTDLSNETKNLQKFKEVYKHEEHLTVPNVYAEYSSSEVMVTQFIEAILPFDYHKLDMEPKALASRVDHLMDSMIFVKGMCHADLHPGNFFWNKEKQLVLIDFGLVHNLPLIDVQHVGTFYYSFVEGFNEFATQYFIDHFIVPANSKNKVDNKEVFKEIYKIVSENLNNHEGFSNIFYLLLKVMSKHQLQLKANYSKIFLTLTTVEGYILTLNPEFDMIENTRQKMLLLAEYASMPEEAENIIFGDWGTYSTALFEDNCSAEEAYYKRNQYVLDSIDFQKGQFVIDVGCGRGGMLREIEKREGKALGITISKVEYQQCLDRNLDCVWSSWQEFDKVVPKEYPKADAIIIIEILVHLASYFENKAGVLDLRLEQLFSWAHAKLKDHGKFYIQALLVTTEFVEGTKHADVYERITNELPGIGGVTPKQLLANSDKYFFIKQIHNHSHDLLPTYYFFKDVLAKNSEQLEKLLKPDVFEYLKLELDVLIELAEKKILHLYRMVFERKDLPKR